MTLMEGGWNPCECDLSDFIYEYDITYSRNDRVDRDNRRMYRCTNHDIELSFGDLVYTLKYDDRDQLYYHLRDMKKGYSTNLETLDFCCEKLPVTKIRFSTWDRIKYFLFPIRLKTN